MKKKAIWVLLAATLALSLLIPGRGGGQTPDRAEVALKAAMEKETVDGDLKAAIEQYRDIAARYRTNRAVAAKALVRMGECYEKLGDAEARKAYERVLRDYADRPEAARARERLAALRSGNGTTLAAGLTTKRIWEGPNVDAFGVPSLDGRYLPVTDWETGDLGLRDFVTGETRRLTNKGTWLQSTEFALFSTLSPDGKRVAYGWFTKDWNFDLRIIGTDGSEPRVLWRGTVQDDEIAIPGGWTPDGKSLALGIQQRSVNGVLGFISVADGSLRVLKKFSGGPRALNGFVRLSPDGRYIAYDRRQQAGGKENDIYLLDVEAGREVVLVQHPANDFAPVWTPDGKNVLFVSDRTGTLGFWLQPVSEGKPKGAPELVKADVGRGWPMGFTRQGSLYYGIDAGLNDVYLARVDFKSANLPEAPAPISQRFVGANSSPVWSPDGEYLAYLSQRGPGTFSMASRDKVLVVRSLDTGQEREVTVDLQIVSFRQWWPDGRSILARGQDRQNRGGIYRIDAQTGAVTPLVQHENNNYGWPALSPDGRTLFYVETNSAQKRVSIRARELATGAEKELYGVAGTAAFIAGIGLSPDGKQLAFIPNNYGDSQQFLKVMPAGGGEPREICRIPGNSAGSARLIWTPDGERILFVTGGAKPQDPHELWEVSAAGGQPQRLGLRIKRLRDLSLHPDGKRLAFAAGDNKGEVWLMENFLPRAAQSDAKHSAGRRRKAG